MHQKLLLNASVRLTRRTRTWNVGLAKGPLTLPVAGNWTVEISPIARVKKLKQRLPQFIMELERRGIHGISHNRWIAPKDELILDEMDRIGIIHASRYPADYSGRVYLTMPGTGGCVDNKGTQLAKWLEDFLNLIKPTCFQNYKTLEQQTATHLYLQHSKAFLGALNLT
jgi:hypothetical protein